MECLQDEIGHGIARDKVALIQVGQMNLRIPEYFPALPVEDQQRVAPPPPQPSGAAQQDLAAALAHRAADQRQSGFHLLPRDLGEIASVTRDRAFGEEEDVCPLPGRLLDGAADPINVILNAGPKLHLGGGDHEASRFHQPICRR